MYFVDIFLALNNKTRTFCCCSLFCLLLFVGTDYKSALSVDENNYCTSERSGLQICYPLTRIITAHPSDRVYLAVTSSGPAFYRDCIEKPINSRVLDKFY